jgi:hypothetical protein
MTEGDFFSLRSVFSLLGRKIIFTHELLCFHRARAEACSPRPSLSDMAKSLYAVVVNVSVAETG